MNTNKQKEPTQMNVSFWRDRNVFVTGGTGMLGSWIVSKLVASDANVVCLVRDQVPHSPILRVDYYKQHVSIVAGQVQDYEMMLRVMNEYEIDTVIHLAAQAIVPIANRSPLSTFDTNIRGTWTMLEAARNSPMVNRVVIASSDKAYGTQPILPYTEDTALVGKYPYDVSKSCADLIGLGYGHAFHMNIGVTRCGNFYGGGDLNWNRLVPGTLRSIYNGEQPIIRSDGTLKRDYVYVEDIAEAYITLAENVHRDDVRGSAFNFGINRPLSVLELVQLMLKATNSKLEPIILAEEMMNLEIREQSLDSSRARTLLGWTPKYSVEEGLQKSAEWYFTFLENRYRNGKHTIV